MTIKNKIFINSLLLLIIFSVFSMISSSTCFALDIKVKDRLEIDGDIVYFGDIATFEPADDSRVKRLKAVEITASPSPDTFRRINRDLILYKIAHLINEDQGIRFSAPDSIIIERTAQVIEGETIEKIFQDYVYDNAPWEKDQIVIEKINTPPSIALPKGVW